MEKKICYIMYKFYIKIGLINFDDILCLIINMI